MGGVKNYVSMKTQNNLQKDAGHSFIDAEHFFIDAGHSFIDVEVSGNLAVHSGDYIIN